MLVYNKDPVYGCWLWTGKTDARGYPWIFEHGRPRWAHRVSFEQSVRPLNPGEELDHTCRRKSCVRPEHLEPVDQRENKRRMHWRVRAKQKHCPAGHDYFSNGRLTPEGGRVCLRCAPV